MKNNVDKVDRKVTRIMSSAGIIASRCPADVVSGHLSAFVAAFIDEAVRVRVEGIIRRNDWSFDIAAKVIRHLDRSKCRLDARDGLPVGWPIRYSGPGVLIVRSELGWHMTIEQASRVVSDCKTDAVFSIIPGERAVLLEHWGGAWYCE